MGPTGAGKSRLARRIYELKKMRRILAGHFIEVNCATLRGDGAMSTLFGHVKGAFTGALRDRRLFSASRARKASVNDADRLRKYLSRFGVTWSHVIGEQA
jgi:sigma54-dependent transcription regulator